MRIDKLCVCVVTEMKMGKRDFDIPPPTLLDRRTKRRRVEVQVMLHIAQSGSYLRTNRLAR